MQDWQKKWFHRQRYDHFWNIRFFTQSMVRLNLNHHFSTPVLGLWFRNLFFMYPMRSCFVRLVGHTGPKLAGCVSIKLCKLSEKIKTVLSLHVVRLKSSHNAFPLPRQWHFVLSTQNSRDNFTRFYNSSFHVDTGGIHANESLLITAPYIERCSLGWSL